MILSLALVLVFAVCVNAYAGDAAAGSTCPVNGFFNSVGGFLYNALPWNWGNWWGK